MKKRMTEGKIFPQLLLFALPLVIGSILQLSYNLFDFIILGWFSSTPITDQAAVGIANPIMSIFISLISGLCLGIAIHSSNLFGRNDIPNLKRQFTSVLLVGLFFILLLTILFIIFLEPIMTISNVTDVVLKKQVKQYLLIIAIGLISTFIYNLYASVLRSIGDSISSLLFLTVSCVLNIALNIIFVVTLKKGVLGVALATLISQLLSAISITIYSKLRYKDIFLFRFKEYVIDTSLLKISIPYAVSSALQQVVLYVGKYIISTQINKYGEIIIDAFASATKIDDFVFTPAQNFAAATSIFFSQNYGANKIKRAKKGFMSGFLLNMIYGVFISIIIFVIKKPVLNIFVSSDAALIASKTEIINNACTYLNIMCCLYMLPSITNAMQSFFRGSGKVTIVFLSTLVQITARVIFVILLMHLTSKPMTSAAFGTGIGWIFMIAFELPILIVHFKQLKEEDPVITKEE